MLLFAVMNFKQNTSVLINGFHFYSDPVSINCIHHTKGGKKPKSLNPRTDFNNTFHCKDLLDGFENLFRSLLSFGFPRTENCFQKK